MRSWQAEKLGEEVDRLHRVLLKGNHSVYSSNPPDRARGKAGTKKKVVRNQENAKNWKIDLEGVCERLLDEEGLPLWELKTRIPMYREVSDVSSLHRHLSL